MFHRCRPVIAAAIGQVSTRSGCRLIATSRRRVFSVCSSLLPPHQRYSQVKRDSRTACHRGASKRSFLPHSSAGDHTWSKSAGGPIHLRRPTPNRHAALPYSSIGALDVPRRSSHSKPAQKHHVSVLVAALHTFEVTWWNERTDPCWYTPSGLSTRSSNAVDELAMMIVRGSYLP